VKAKNGFALVATMMVLILVMPLALVGAGIAIASRKDATRDYWQARTFYVADGAVEWALADLERNLAWPRMGVGDSLYLGSFDLDRVRGEAWIVREGVDSIGAARNFVLYGRGFTVPGFRESVVAIDVVMSARPPWDLYAPLVSLTGSRKNGTAGIMQGHASCPLGEAVAGIIAPDGTVIESGHGVILPGDSLGWLDGDPPLVYDTQENLIDLLGFDEWPYVRDTLVVDANTPNKKMWPYTQLAAGQWMTIRLTDSGFALRSGHSGQGLLIVPGNLDIGGGFTWDGLLLVGGSITINGDVTISGSILAGLNMIDGTFGSGTPIDLGNGTAHIQYDLCVVQHSLMRGNLLLAEEGGWREIKR